MPGFEVLAEIANERREHMDDALEDQETREGLPADLWRSLR